MLSSCSFIEDFKEEIKTELKKEIKSEMEKDKQFNLKIIDDTLLGVEKWEVDKEYGCSISGNLKFNIKVPEKFTGIVDDNAATFLIKGKEYKMNFYDYFVDGKSVDGTNIYSYVASSDRLTKKGLMICSINSTDDIKLKSFSDKVIVIEGLKPILK